MQVSVFNQIHIIYIVIERNTTVSIVSGLRGFAIQQNKQSGDSCGAPAVISMHQAHKLTPYILCFSSPFQVRLLCPPFNQQNADIS